MAAPPDAFSREVTKVVLEIVEYIADAHYWPYMKEIEEPRKYVLKFNYHESIFLGKMTAIRSQRKELKISGELMGKIKKVGLYKEGFEKQWGNDKNCLDIYNDFKITQRIIKDLKKRGLDEPANRGKRKLKEIIKFEYIKRIDDALLKTNQHKKLYETSKFDIAPGDVNDIINKLKRLAAKKREK